MNQGEANQVVDNAIWNALQGVLEWSRAMIKPGVSLTPEQQVQIEAMIETGNAVGAMGVLLELFETSFANNKVLNDGSRHFD